ncbi:MAG: ATPase, T2SS/T4P/T4SS family, partial [Pseudobdellovibrionaceae bacterium]
MSLKVGEILVQQGIIKKEQLLTAIEAQKKTNQRLTAVLMSMGFVKDAQVRQALEAFYKIPAIDVSSFDIDREVIQLVSRTLCEKRNLIPLQNAGSNLVVAFSDPSNMDDRENIRMLTKLKIQPVIGTPVAIAAAIEKYYGGQQREEVLKQIQNVQPDEDQGETFGIQGAEMIDESNAEDVPVVRFINTILTDAIRRKVSDIHFEPYEKRYRVRFRADGLLIEAGSPPQSMKDAIA